MPETPFKLTTPCVDCPFRAVPARVNGRLFPATAIREERVEQIADSIRTGASFHCHKTLDRDEEGDLHAGPNSQECAGALATQANGEELENNQMVRIAYRLGVFNPEDLADAQGLVYDGLEEWEDAMAERRADMEEVAGE